MRPPGGCACGSGSCGQARSPPLAAALCPATRPTSRQTPAGKGSLDNINLFSVITIVSFFLLAPVALLVDGLVWTPSALAAAGVDQALLAKRALLAAVAFHAYQQARAGGGCAAWGSSGELRAWARRNPPPAARSLTAHPAAPQHPSNAPPTPSNAPFTPPAAQVSYMILQRVSPVTHSIGNSVKRVVVIASSVRPPTPPSASAAACASRLAATRCCPLAATRCRSRLAAAPALWPSPFACLALPPGLRALPRGKHLRRRPACPLKRSRPCPSLTHCLPASLPPHLLTSTDPGLPQPRDDPEPGGHGAGAGRRVCLQPGQAQRRQGRQGQGRVSAAAAPRVAAHPPRTLPSPHDAVARVKAAAASTLHAVA